VQDITEHFPLALKITEERKMTMSRTFVFFLPFLLLFLFTGALVSMADPLGNPPSTDDGSGLLGNPREDRPNQVNLYYNNRAGIGYIFYNNSEPYILIDSIVNMFPSGPEITTQEGSAISSGSGQVPTQSGGSVIVNGNTVDLYYYRSKCYLNLLSYCTAAGLIPKYTQGGIIFLARSDVKFTIPSASSMPINVSINNITSGNNSDPINNTSYLLEVGLTNTTNQNITLSHLNFIVVGNSGRAYVSVKNMTYTVVFGNNDTPDNITLDPKQQHMIQLTFDLPEDDTPKNFIILQGQKVLGKRGCF